VAPVAARALVQRWGDDAILVSIAGGVPVPGKCLSPEAARPSRKTRASYAPGVGGDLVRSPLSDLSPITCPIAA